MKKELISLVNQIKEIELVDYDDLFIDLTNSDLFLKLAYFGDVSEININANVNENAHLNIVFADFSSSNLNTCVKINLNGIEGTCDWKLATLGHKKENKKFDISFIHNKEKTSAVMDNYGVSKDESSITFSGVNHIKEKCIKSITRQNAKIIVFDEKAKGNASPILKIDENDVIASHGAVVGQISDEHLFYLMSRGLTKEEARELIIKGYLSPVSSYFSNEVKSRIETAIGEGL